MSFFGKKFKKRYFSSIRVKFVIVYVLVNIISLQLIGLFFTTQLRTTNINTFEQNIMEQEKILNYHIREELDKDKSNSLTESNNDTKSTDTKSSITKLVSEFNIQKLLLVSVIDKDSKIVASSSKNGNDDYLSKRSFDPQVSQVLKTGESAKKIQTNPDTNRRVWLYVSPIKKDNEVVGVVSLMADIESVYPDRLPDNPAHHTPHPRARTRNHPASAAPNHAVHYRRAVAGRCASGECQNCRQHHVVRLSASR